MAERSAKRNEYVLNPMFYIPEGVDEFIYDDNVVISEEEQEDFFLDDDDSGVPDDTTIVDENDNEGSGPPVPQAFSIVSQTLRTGPGGQQVVDLVIEVEDMPNISQYQFRVTKV